MYSLTLYIFLANFRNLLIHISFATAKAALSSLPSRSLNESESTYYKTWHKKCAKSRSARMKKLAVCFLVFFSSMEAIERSGFEISTGPGYRQDRVEWQIFFNDQRAPFVMNREIYPAYQDV